MNSVRPGRVALTSGRCTAYALPDGLASGVPVTILSCSAGGHVVRDSNGREWTVALQNLNPGWMYRIHDRWLPEEHPVVVETLAARSRKTVGQSPERLDIAPRFVA